MSKKPKYSPFKFIIIFVLSSVVGYLIHKAIPVANISQVTDSSPVTVNGTITIDDYGNYLLIGIDDPNEYYFLQGQALTSELSNKDYTVSGYLTQSDAEVPVLQTTSYKLYSGSI